MRTNVSFRYPAEFVPVSEEDGVLAVSGAEWFVSLLRRVPGLLVEGELCQEDWGVVAFAQRDGKKFWIGLSMWADGECSWLVHFHHGSFAFLQWLSASGKNKLQGLVSDFHSVLANDSAVSEIVWYEERDMGKAQPAAFASPVGN